MKSQIPKFNEEKCLRFDGATESLGLIAEKAVWPVQAGMARKRRMREELLAHLLEIHEQELARLGDERAARAAVEKRFGDVGELARQLQEAVPRLEQLVFFWLGRKEIVMKRVLWTLAIAGIVVGESIDFRFGEVALFTGVTLACALVFIHLLKEKNLASRLMGRRWPWLVGCVAVLFGPAMILPAMAQLGRGGVVWFVMPMIVGSLITLCGFWFLGCGMREGRVQAR